MVEGFLREMLVVQPDVAMQGLAQIIGAVEGECAGSAPGAR